MNNHEPCPIMPMRTVDEDILLGVFLIKDEMDNLETIISMNELLTVDDY